MFPDPEIVKVFKDNNVAKCLSLYRTHEDADTRIILHTLAVDKQFGHSGIKCLTHLIMMC